MSSPFRASPSSPDDAPDDFTFAFRAYDDLRADQRWSTWPDIEPLCRGPEPRPAWVVTSSGAIDTDLGVLKTGKEADVHLIERSDPHHQGDGVVLAAKRYRSVEHRSFQRAAAYTEGRSTRRSRDERALKRKSTFGRQVAAAEWAVAEWAALVRAWRAGLPVPYPVQIDGTELLMEWICEPVGWRDAAPGSSPATAPRLAQTRPAADLLDDYFDQVRTLLAGFTQAGLVHGDLSPYNVLAAGERLVVIDLPQIVDLVGNARGFELLLRDCVNMCDWFTRRGLEVDADELFADLIAHAF